LAVKAVDGPCTLPVKRLEAAAPVRCLFSSMELKLVFS
jgi:hypothetical protein